MAQSETYKLALQKQKFQQRLESKKLKSSQKSIKKRISSLGQIKVAPQLSTEQEMLGSLFGNGDKVLTGGDDSLPKLHGHLMPNQFADEIGNDETSEIFGFGINKSRSGLF